MSEPAAYFLTWHGHGTWLHGDRKGSVGFGHSQYDTPLISPDRNRQKRSRTQFNAPVILNQADRVCVQETIQEVSHRRHWTPLAIHVRTTHVHVIIQAAAPDEKVLVDLKAYCTRNLRAESRSPPERKIWSEHGSTRYLWNEKSVERAMQYVIYEQGDILIPAPFQAEIF